jgi:hypothetical protein
MGSAMNLELEGTALHFTTSREGRNMGDYTRKFLEKKL